MRNRLILLAATATALACAATGAATAGTAPGSTHTAGDALALVMRVYQPYANATDATSLLGTCYLPASARRCPADAATDVSSALRTRLRRSAQSQDADPVICAQNVPTHVTYGVGYALPGTTTIVVHARYGASGDHPVRVTVDLHSLRLSAIDCAPAPDTDARVTTWNPFTAHGRLGRVLRAVSAPGTCVGDASAPVASPAQRCFELNTVRDPCFEPPGGIDPGVPVVLCARRPWQHTVVRLRLIRGSRGQLPALPPAAFGTSRPRLPWAIRLAGGERCLFAQGANPIVGGRRLNYSCGEAPFYDGDRLHLYGAVDRSRRRWHIQATRHSDGRGLHPVVVAHIWR